MTRILYELAGRDGHMFSPYCWRTILALAHKGLDYARVPMTFTDRSPIAASGQERVPVLEDDGRMIHDSWTIACHLDDAYPDRPRLFAGAAARAQALFFNRWVDMAVHPELRVIVVPDVLDHTHADDTAWFKDSREKMFGRSLDALRLECPVALRRLEAVLEPVRVTLAAEDFLSGDAPAYADYILFGSLMWARSASPVRLFAADDPIFAWRARMLGLFDGLAAKAPGFAEA